MTIIVGFVEGSVVDVVGASVVVMVVFTTGNGCCVAGIRNVDGAGVTGIVCVAMVLGGVQNAQKTLQLS